MNDSLENKWRASFLWTVVKGFVFAACLVCLSYQTVAFYKIYIRYQTTISTEVRRDEPFILPAVTFCYKNTVSRSTFCSNSPHLCEEPRDLLKFCHEQPHFCRGNLSNLVIPKLGYYTSYSSEANEMALSYLFNDTGDVPLYLEKKKMKILFVEGEQDDVYAKCFSERLHLFDGDASLKTMEIDVSLFSDNLIGMYKLRIPAYESLYAWDTNRVFFSIHSPFVPINPLREGISVRPGFHYYAQVRLNKDYLLPHPYQTDCIHYNISWMKNNLTGPRSQDACKELCRSVFLKDCFGCDPGRIMIEDPKDLCTPGTKLHRPYYFWRYITAVDRKVDLKGIPSYLNVCLPYVEAHEGCQHGCKPDCVKLYYEYSVVETAKDPSPMELSKENENEAEIQIYVKSPDIKLLLHKPLYTNGDLYSYVGGLMGLWLGISAWTFAGIAEKLFRKSLELRKRRHIIKC